MNFIDRNKVLNSYKKTGVGSIGHENKDTNTKFLSNELCKKPSSRQKGGINLNYSDIKGIFIHTSNGKPTFKLNQMLKSSYFVEFIDKSRKTRFYLSTIKVVFPSKHQIKSKQPTYINGKIIEFQLVHTAKAGLSLLKKKKLIISILGYLSTSGTSNIFQKLVVHKSVYNSICSVKEVISQKGYFYYEDKHLLKKYVVINDYFPLNLKIFTIMQKYQQKEANTMSIIEREFSDLFTSETYCYNP